MITFASPNWAAGDAMQRLLIFSAVVMAISVVGIILGVRVLRHGSAKLGWVLVLMGCLLPIFCYYAAHHTIRLDNGTHRLGSYPGDKIKVGMSGDEVKAILGPPHQRQKDIDRETWIYWSDSYGGYRFGVEFGADGHVTGTYGN